MPPIQFERVEAAKLTKLYGRQRALAGVNLTLERGRVCAVLGPNGAGKSTLLGILSTLVRPTSGEVRYVGGTQGEPDPVAVRSAIGLVAHEPLVYGELTALENLKLYGRLYDVPELDGRIARVLGEVGLEESAWRRPARGYSRGMLQRLSLARALLHEPSVLLLDEPFTGLDRTGSAALSEALARVKEEGKIVLCITHDLEALARVCDHVVVLRRGRVTLDDARDEPFTYEELKALYHEHTSSP